MNKDAALPRWLIVVRRDQVDLYRNLCDAFSGVPGVAVVLDRRQGERRRERTSSKASGQRRAQRRKSPTQAELDLWESAGFRLIHKADDLQVYEAEDQPSA